VALLKDRTVGRALETVWWIALATSVGLFAAVAVRMLLYPHEVAVSEGAVGLGVQSVLDGVPMYGETRWIEPPYVILHYTPIYYLLAAAVAWLTGPGFLAGRLVSILATAGTGVAAGLLARRRGAGIGGAVMAGALWLSFYQVVFWGTIQRVDAPAILFEAIGLLVYVRARGRGRLGLGAVPWFVAAWATKQVMFIGLLACIADLLVEDRGRPGRAARFAVAGWAPILLLFGLLTLWSRGGFWTATVLGTVSFGHADPPWVIFSNAELFFGWPWNMLMLVLATWAAWLWPGDRLLGLYLWIGLVLAIVFDANLPRFFPPMLAMAVLVPLLLESARSRSDFRPAIVFALVLTFSAHQLYEMRSLVRERVLSLHEGNERLGLAEVVRRHTSGNGPVLAQDVGMLLSAHRSVTMADPLVFSILAGNDAWDPEVLAEGVRERRYEAVILNRPLEELEPDEWTTLWIYPSRQALLDHYRLAETATCSENWRFLEPTRYVYVPEDRP
jgi:hypothetical protein